MEENPYCLYYYHVSHSFLSIWGYVLYRVTASFAQGDNITTDLSRSSNTSVTTVNQTTSDDVEKLYNEGYLMSNLGRYKDAINYFDKVLKIDPHHIDSLYFYKQRIV